MKISLKWLKHIYPFTLSPKEIDQLLTNSGLEVEELETFQRVKGGLKGVVVGKVVHCVPHPNADRLRVCQVTTDGQETKQIVCGAPNVAEGQKVAVATVGTEIHLPDGTSFVIKKSKIRGEESNGMLCAEDELGLGNSHEGIMVLSEDAPLGKPLSEFLGLEDDTIIHIGLTPNRTDAMSHMGVARELYACMIEHGRHSQHNTHQIEALLMPDIKEIGAGEAAFTVNNLDGDAFPLYSGVMISGVNATISSPDWMKERLTSIGISPKNAIVDVTNYVMHHLGQPLHAFDAAKVKGSAIVLRRSTEKEKINLLVGGEKELPAGVVVVANESIPMAVAGVMGSADHSINDETTSVILESAWFNASDVRKASSLLGVKTDSSYRFERGIDPSMVTKALSYAAELICTFAGGTIDGNAVVSRAKAWAPVRIELRYKKIDQILGNVIARDRIESILLALGFTIVEAKTDGLLIDVPGYRVDVRREIDVIEEIIRVFGFDSLISNGYVSYRPGVPTNWANREKIERLADALVARGFNEIISKSFIDPQVIHSENQAALIKPSNPLNEQLSALRPSLLFGGLEAIQWNQNRQQSDAQLFEIGNVFYQQEGIAKEDRRIGLWMTGRREPETWRQASAMVEFYDLQSQLWAIAHVMGIEEMRFEQQSSTELTDSVSIQLSGKHIGRAGKVNPELSKKFGIKQPVWFAEIIIEGAEKRKEGLLGISKEVKKASEAAKFPHVRRDLALLVSKTVSYQDLKKAAIHAAKPYLEEVNLFDVYEGDKIAEDKKSYALGFVFRDSQKTLTESDVEKVMNKLIATFETDFSASLRQ